MPSSNVSWPIPLWRQRIFYPGQLGVPGTDSEEGIRTDSHGTVFYVDPNAAGVSDARDGTDPRHPLQTVAAALTHCQAYHGDVVAVMANNSWQYGDATDGRAVGIQESVFVDVPGVRIVGVCPSGQGVYWSPAANLGTCITVRAIDVTIEGFFFWSDAFGGADGIYVVWDGATTFGENVTIRHCTFGDGIDTAIELVYTWFSEVAHCQFWQCDEYGIYSDPAGAAVGYSIIHDNLFQNCLGGAISIEEATDCHIYHNSIYNSTAQGGAAATDLGIDTSTGARNQVYDNWFSCALLGVGGWADLNSGSGTDAWINNHCTDGDTTTTP